jgi:signal transduction histidine kinase/ligand-binding sensor domain-containing protein
VFAGVCVLLAGGQAFGLDPTRSLDQFTTTKWTEADGAPDGIGPVTQSLDGYLWLGTKNGLYRFDGASFERIPPAFPAGKKSDYVTALLAAKSGDLWVGHDWGGVSVYAKGKWIDADSQLRGTIAKIVETSDGAIWVEQRGPAPVLRRFYRGRWESVGADWGVPPGPFYSLYAAHDGSLWLSLYGSVLRLAPGSHRFETADDGAAFALVIEPPSGGAWLLSAAGIHRPRLTNRVPVRRSFEQGYWGAIIDRDGSLWASSTKLGLVRFRAPFGSRPVAERFANLDALAPGPPAEVAEDREGDIWVDSILGLTRIRPKQIFKLPLFQNRGFNFSYISQVYSTSKGLIYTTAEANDGLFRIDRDSITNIEPSRPVAAYVGNRGFCADRSGGFWTALPDGPIEHFTGGQHVLIGRPAGTAGPGRLLFSCFANGGDVWGSILPSGVFRFDGSTWASANLIDDWKSHTLYPVATDAQGRGLVYTNGGSLWRVDGNRVETLWRKQDNAISRIDSIYPDGNSVYIGGDSGLARFDGHAFSSLSANDYYFLKHVTGIARTSAGYTWLFTSSGVVQLTNDQLDRAFVRPKSPLDVRIFDGSDGLPGPIADYSYNQLVAARDGTLWLGTTAGVAWFDPNRIYRNLLPPPVSIRAVTANGVHYQPGAAVRLPPNISNLQIDYTALSLQAPNRVRFRYKLKGVDGRWVDPGTRRQAFYTNLSPGNYVFQVIASNNDGVWNNTGASLNLSIRPTFLQSKLFLVLCVISASGIVWAFYTLRLQQISTRLRLMMGARIAERERIARELHDTFLQSAQAMIFRFQAVADGIPPDQPAAAEIEQELARAETVLIEGRNRVRNLRTYDSSENLPEALRGAARRILSDTPLKVSIVVEGRQRNVQEEICDAVGRIADEFLFNTRQHARAANVFIQIVFERRRLLVRMADDGIGIDAAVLEKGGRPGHFGLTGMRERAEQIQADLTLAGRGSQTGTELTLVLPGEVAYVASGRLFGAWIAGAVSSFRANA